MTRGRVEQPVFMVEAYRSSVGEAVEPRRVDVHVDGTVIVGVIDIPSDEVALFLVIAADASTAGELVRARGLRPIRVVPAHWDGLDDAASDDWGSG